MEINGCRIQCLTFDLDDTLWECAPVIIRAETIFFEWLEQHFPQIATDFDMTSLTAHRCEVFAGFPNMSHDFSWLRQRWLERLADEYRCDRDKLAVEGFRVFHQARNDVTLFDGAVAVLQAASERYCTGSITNGNADVGLVGIDHLFNFSVTAAGAGAAKPHPKSFQAAIDSAQLSAEKFLHIGNDPERDVRGAANAGMHTLWINVGEEPWQGDDRPDMELRYIRELLPLLHAAQDTSCRPTQELPGAHFELVS